MQIPLTGSTSLELADAEFQAVITAGLALFALVLYRRMPQRWVAWWAAAWGLYVLRLSAIVMYFRTANLVWLFGHQVATGWVALAILWAALVFSRNALWRPWYLVVALFPPALAAVAIRWVAVHGMNGMAIVAVPTLLLIAGATLWTGWVFWRYAGRHNSFGARFVAIAFVLWGLHHLDYPLRARGAWEPWGYFLDILFELSVGVGFGIMALSDLAQRLATRTEELGQLSVLMVRQHEAERRRLSRDLHDETAQTLSAVKLEIGMLREGADSSTEGRLDHVLHLVDNGIRGIRRVMNDLRPALLDDLGLMPAIRSLADDVRERSTLTVDVDLPASAPRLGADAELALFRAAQEALANVIRHAEATRVSIRLRSNAANLRLTVTDDGRGFPAAGAVLDPSAHLGLAGMRERIAALGGRTSITAVDPRGLAITVELPTGAGEPTDQPITMSA